MFMSCWMLWAFTATVNRAVPWRTSTETFIIEITSFLSTSTTGCTECLGTSCGSVRSPGHGGSRVGTVLRDSHRLPGKECIQRPPPGTNDQQKDQTQKYREVY